MAESFGSMLKRLRNEKGLSFAGLAEATGLGTATLKDYEGERRAPQFASVQLIVRALGIPFESFDGCTFPHADRSVPKPAARRKKK